MQIVKRSSGRSAGTREAAARVRALLVCCTILLSLGGCFLRSIVGYVTEDGAATLSGNVEVKFCDFDTVVEDFYGCSYTITGLSGSPIEITSTFELVTAFGLFGVIIDPMIIQLPADATITSATYNNAGADEPLVQTITDEFAVTPTRSISAEPGTRFAILELPDAVAAAIDPAGEEFNFSLQFDVPPGPPPVIKFMLTGLVELMGTRYYIPVCPCKQDFAEIPEVVLPVGSSFEDLRFALNDVITQASSLACDQVSYDFMTLPDLLFADSFES